MTTERDFDRLARAWLDLGPNEAPDRVVAAVLQAAETTPQVRRPIRWPIRRSFHMTRLPIVATIVATLVVVIGGGMFIIRGNDPSVGVPMVSPSPSPSATAAIPVELRYHWIGEPRDIPGHGTTTRTAIDFTTGTYFADGTDYPSGILGSVTRMVGPDQVELETVATTTDCAVGDIGRYAFALSPGGTRLTMTQESDDCAARGVATAGDWFRVACKSTENGCWGDLEAGTYPSQYVAPRVKPGDTWTPAFGAITFTVPDGWSNSSDWPSDFTLTPTEAYAKWSGTGLGAEHFSGISIWTQPAVTDPSKDCFSAAPDVPRTVAALVGHLESSPALEVSLAADVDIDGHLGKSIDVEVAPDWTGTCPGADGAVNVLIHGGLDAPWVYGPFPGEPARLIFLELGEGDVVLIAIEPGTGTTLDEMVTQAIPIIESMTFK
jgi:hypothetical protein